MVAGRSHAGFNPASGRDVKLFGAVLDGNHLVQGFRNADIREALFGLTDEAAGRRRQSAQCGPHAQAVTRARLDSKSPASRRWHVTQKGQRVLGAVLKLYHHGIPEVIGKAA